MRLKKMIVHWRNKMSDKYNKEIFFNDLYRKIQQGEVDIKDGKIHKLRDVFKELRYEYDIKEINQLTIM